MSAKAMPLQINSEADAVRLKHMLVALARSPDYIRRSLLLFAVLCEQAGESRGAHLLRAVAERNDSFSLRQE